MGRKNRSKKMADPGKAAEFKINPFAALDIPTEKAAAPQPEARSVEAQRASAKQPLTAADASLLKAFTASEDRALEKTPDAKPRKGLVRLSMQRKGRGGKTVTRAAGLAQLEVVAQMELLQQVRRELGVGGRFDEDILEVQGEQRQRLGEWFSAQGYDVRG